MTNSNLSQTSLLEPRFGEGFLNDHAGLIITNPHIAIVELAANSWDAGARRVEITWPEEENGYFKIVDDGTGMSKEEFEKIWPELNYNRVKNQGNLVKFPDKSFQIKRPAYGKNGKGRHSMFCFSDEYYVETWKNGVASLFKVKRSHGKLPFEIEYKKQFSKEGHGTIISCNLIKHHFNVEDIRNLLGSKFITDPEFNLFLNNQIIKLVDLEKISEIEEYQIPGEIETVKIFRIDSQERGRLSLHHGVAWWVNKRLVGSHSWQGIEGAYLDGRTSEARRYTFIVEADLLSNEVKSDWSWFKESDRAKKIIDHVNSLILHSIQKVLQNVRHHSKKEVLKENLDEIRSLSSFSKEQVGYFIDEIQMKCPRMTHQDLTNTVKILANMELSRTGYNLLQQLIYLSPDDIDNLNEILKDWDINDAKKVLDELQWRLDLINELEILVDNPKTKELQELQPLFARGLWIFGPEYESLQFTSNKSLKTVLEEFFGGGKMEEPYVRPDFVALPESTIGIYSSDRYDDENAEVSGIDKVLIVELKKGGSTIGLGEARQGEDYAIKIFKSGKIEKSTKIVCFVLGSKVDCDKLTYADGNIITIPKSYNIILRQAHNRTFKLMEKIKEIKGITEEITDIEVKEILAQQDIRIY